MAVDPNSSKRQNVRHRIACDLSANLIAGADRKPLRAMGVNVSREGLGIVAFELLPPESKVILVLKTRGITLKVAWCRPDPARDGIFHSGLECQDPAVNLMVLMKEDGLVRSPAEWDLMITFESVREALALAHSTDPRLLRTGQLAPLNARYHAYPVRIAGASLVLLLPKGMKASDAAKLTEEEARNLHILIARADRGVLALIWPESR